MELLASVFGIDILTYAILSNHMHLVIRNRPDVVNSWSDRELAIRWLRVFPGRRIDEQLAEPMTSDVDIIVNNKERLAIVKLRMSDPSWFMRALCEPIARMANQHDECTGRFWEGRFKAQKITDEAGLLACSMYVDLNPIRAAMAETPEESVHTSAFDRIRSIQAIQIDSAAADLSVITNKEAGRRIRNTPIKELKAQRTAMKKQSRRKILSDAWLCPLTIDERMTIEQREGSGLGGRNRPVKDAVAGVRLQRGEPVASAIGSGVRCSDKGFLSMKIEEYLKLLDWTGRQGRIDKRGKIPSDLQPIFSRLGIDSSMWCDLVWNFKRYFGGGNSAGKPDSLAKDASNRNRKWSRGQRISSECFVG